MTLSYPIPAVLIGDNLALEITAATGVQNVKVYADETTVFVVVPEGTDSAAVAAVVAAHTGSLTPKQQEAVTYAGDARQHLQHLKDYLAADPATITNAQTVHVVQDLIRAVRYLNRLVGFD